ncbi:MAG: hypothetical protein WCH11_00485 [Bdellovibrio sp.]
MFANSFRFWLLAAGAIIYVGCAPVKFSADVDCGAFGGECVRVDGRAVGKPQTFSMNGGKVDVIVINDNSASMSPYQEKLADRLESLLAVLDGTRADYRLAITTTDISSKIGASPMNPPRRINQNGELQDGRLVSFSNGLKFLTPKDTDRLRMFREAIKRNETDECDRFLRSSGNLDWNSAGVIEHCVSGDERGLFAAQLVLKNNPAGVIRNDSVKVVFVIITNEDVRSGSYAKVDQASDSTYRLWTEDSPNNLLTQFRALYPRKTLEFSTIGILPGELKAGLDAETVASAIFDSFRQGGSLSMQNTPDKFFSNRSQACFDEANRESTTANVTPGFSYLYSLMSLITGGIQTSLCEKDYGKSLEAIAKNAIRNRFYVCPGLRIEKAWMGDVQNEVSGRAINVRVEEDGFARFPDDLSPGELVNLKFSCSAVRR